MSGNPPRPPIAWVTRGRCHLLGDDIVHDNGMMEWKHVIERETDPAILIPCLFKAIDPGLAEQLSPGDFLIAGKGFGSGKPHFTAYIALASLGVRVLCESSFEKVVRGAANLGVPIMSGCLGLLDVLSSADEIEVDMVQGQVTRLADGHGFAVPPLRPSFRQLIENGGRSGILAKWLEAHPEFSQSLEVAA